MVKQWFNSNLNVTYFHLPNSKNNEILTVDGVLLPYNDFKSMSSEVYSQKKNTSSQYDYELSKQSERLVKKATNLSPTNTLSSSNGVSPNTSNDFARSSNTIISKNETPKIKVSENKVEPKSLPQKKIKIPKADENVEFKDNKTHETAKSDEFKIDTKSEVKSIESAIPSKEEKKEGLTETKKKFNWFDFAYPKLTLIIVIICSCLSIYFTGTYMQRLQSVHIAYAISCAILIYGIIGMQIARRSWKAKKYVQSFMFGITAVSVIGFSMLSAVDVNYAKFKESHQLIEENYNVNEGKKLSYDLMKDELAENKKQIELLNEDIKFQQTQWILSWDNDLKKNVLLEGRISATAQQKITDDNKRIEELNTRNKEINEKLMKYAESGISVEKTESKTERAKSLTDLLGALFGISGNVVQLIILLIPSIFTDLINLLGTSIYVDSFENDKEKY